MVITTLLRSAGRGYVDMLASLWVGEVARARPSSGSLPRSEHLIYFRLLHESNGGVEAKEFESSLKAVMDVQVALPVTVRVVLDLGGA